MREGSVPFGELPPELQEMIATEIRLHAMESAEGRRERRTNARQGRWLAGAAATVNTVSTAWNLARGRDVSVFLAGINAVAAAGCWWLAVVFHRRARHLRGMT